jgi:hypothetical protein
MERGASDAYEGYKTDDRPARRDGSYGNFHLVSVVLFTGLGTR